MNLLLKNIISDKRLELKEKKKFISLNSLRGRTINYKSNRDVFINALRYPKTGDVAIIAEIKLASPIEGKLADVKEIEERSILYEKSSTDAISLVVDKKYFGGEMEFIKRIKNAVSLPILTKDFIIDPYQIYEMKFYGADAILLIAKILENNQLVKFVKLVTKLGMEPVVEVQTEQELKDALNTDTQIIAVNARDLNTFKIDIDRACGLLKLIPQKYVTLGFSGVKNRKDVKQYKKAGAKGVLVGTSLMKSKDIKGFIRELKGL